MIIVTVRSVYSFLIFSAINFSTLMVSIIKTSWSDSNCCQISLFFYVLQCKSILVWWWYKELRLAELHYKEKKEKNLERPVVLTFHPYTSVAELYDWETPCFWKSHTSSASLSFSSRFTQISLLHLHLNVDVVIVVILSSLSTSPHSILTFS